MYDLVITNAHLVDEHQQWHGGLAVTAGTISALLASDHVPPAHHTIDAHGQLLLPGLVDPHVHFNQPGRTEWEGFITGSSSAAAGGVTMVIDMPLNSFPAVTDAASLLTKRQSLASSSLIDYALWGGLVSDNLATLAEQAAAGAIAFKAFMSNSGIDDFAAVTDAVLYQGLQQAAQHGWLVAVHAESETLPRHLTSQIQASGRTDRQAWLDSRPPWTELEAIQRVLLLAHTTGARLHIVHVSLAAGIDLITQARQQGLDVSCETCPHYLCLTSDDLLRYGPDAKCAPPLRDTAEVEHLWQRVLTGQVDLIASDHSPCPTADKRRGDHDIWQAWGGISGVQFTLPLLLTEGVQRRGLPLPAVVRLTSSQAARRFGLFPRKGSLHPGADADLVLVDPQQHWTVTPDLILARHRHTPYIGRTMHGAVTRTFVRGQQMYPNTAQIQPGYGQYIGR